MNQPQQNGHIFVVGVGRSGTTLMRVLLDAHRRICCGPEMKTLQETAALYQSLAGRRAQLEAYHNTPADLQRCFREFIDNLSANFRRASGKPRWAEKTPQNIIMMPTLGMIFPDARFIHMIRDGRDVACSLVSMNWTDSAGQKIPYTLNFRNAGSYWREIVRFARQQAASPLLAGRVLEVRYESLVADVEATMRSVLNFLGEEWDPAILQAHKKDRSHEPVESSTHQATRPIYETSIARWKRDMSPADKLAFKAEAGALLKELGYVSDDQW